MKSVRIKQADVTADIHFESTNVDYTLCGITASSDNSLGIGDAEATHKRVSCPHCIAIVKACKAIPYTAYETEAQQSTRKFHS